MLLGVPPKVHSSWSLVEPREQDVLLQRLRREIREIAAFEARAPASAEEEGGVSAMLQPVLQPRDEHSGTRVNGQVLLLSIVC